MSATTPVPLPGEDGPEATLRRGYSITVDA